MHFFLERAIDRLAADLDGRGEDGNAGFEDREPGAPEAEIDQERDVVRRAVRNDCARDRARLYFERKKRESGALKAIGIISPRSRGENDDSDLLRSGIAFEMRSKS